MRAGNSGTGARVNAMTDTIIPGARQCGLNLRENLLNNTEACAYVYYENGIAKCAIEKAFLNGEIDFRKPISCHLYPIRIKKLPDYDALNYHRWFVCEDAYRLGEEMKLPVYRFLKEPLIRKYGDDWYELLESEVKKRR